MNEKEFRKKNHEIIMEFMKECSKKDDDISGSVQATIAQFLLNLRIELHELSGGKGWVTAEQIVTAQITEMRRCIVDLQECKERLTNGVVLQ